MHQHQWSPTGVISTFVEDQPNAKRRPALKSMLICHCGERAFKFVGNPVVYTWPADQSKWIEEARC